jgi:RsiW-degrading membrane proteinase PrsW (M82 family)
MEDTISKEILQIEEQSHEHSEVDYWDRLGILLSALCAIHCLLTPILMITLPLIAEEFENPLVHIVLALFVVPVGCYAFLSGYKHHKNKNIMIWGLVGVFIVGMTSLLPIFVEHFHDIEIPVMILGSLILLTAHLKNRKSCECPH